MLDSIGINRAAIPSSIAQFIGRLVARRQIASGRVAAGRVAAGRVAGGPHGGRRVDDRLHASVQEHKPAGLAVDVKYDRPLPSHAGTVQNDNRADAVFGMRDAHPEPVQVGIERPFASAIHASQFGG